MNNVELIEEIREKMPESIAGIGYGSGMYRQKGYAANEKPDKDIILVVDNLYRFLSEDYFLNPGHFYDGAERRYRTIRDKDYKFFYNKIGCLKFTEGQYRFKVLIVEKDALLCDLKTWKSFALAARLAKPIVYSDLPEEIENLILYNRNSVVLATLLLDSHNDIAINNFYKNLSNLSYIGDWRMITHSERATKSSDIVDGAFDEFEKMYGENSLLNRVGDVVNNIHPVELIKELPTDFQNYLMKNLDNVKSLKELEKMVYNYFFYKNLTNSPLLMYSCCKTLGLSKSTSHVMAKRRKGNSSAKK